MMSILLVFIPYVISQDGIDRQVRGIAEQLRSDRVEVREAAAQKLRKIGKPAVPELQKFAGDADKEVSARARLLLAQIGLAPLLSPDIRGAVPGIET